MVIRSKVPNEAYRNNYDRIFNRKNVRREEVQPEGDPCCGEDDNRPLGDEEVDGGDLPTDEFGQETVVPKVCRNSCSC